MTSRTTRIRMPLLMLVCMLLVVAAPVLAAAKPTAVAAAPGVACGGVDLPAWHASPSRLTAVTGFAGQSPTVDQTLRLVIHPHAGRGSVRVRLSNRYGGARSRSVRSTWGSWSRAHGWWTDPIGLSPSAGSPR